MATPTAQEMLDAYLNAELALLSGGQSVRFNDGANDRWVTKADLEWIQKGVALWRSQVARDAARAARAPNIGGLSYSVARLD